MHAIKFLRFRKEGLTLFAVLKVKEKLRLAWTRLTVKFYFLLTIENYLDIEYKIMHSRTEP